MVAGLYDCSVCPVCFSGYKMCLIERCRKHGALWGGSGFPRALKKRRIIKIRERGEAWVHWVLIKFKQHLANGEVTAIAVLCLRGSEDTWAGLTGDTNWTLCVVVRVRKITDVVKEGTWALKGSLGDRLAFDSWWGWFDPAMWHWYKLWKGDRHPRDSLGYPGPMGRTRTHESLGRNGKWI